MKSLTEQQLRDLLEEAWQDGMDYGEEYYDIMSEETPKDASNRRKKIANELIERA